MREVNGADRVDDGRKLSVSEGDSKQSSRFGFDIKREGRAETESDGLMGRNGGE